jgi:hypothetical protein
MAAAGEHFGVDWSSPRRKFRPIDKSPDLNLVQLGWRCKALAHKLSSQLNQPLRV